MHRALPMPHIIDPISAILRDSKGEIARSKSKSLPAHHHSRIHKREVPDRVQLAKTERHITANRSLESISIFCDCLVCGLNSRDLHRVGSVKFSLKNLEAVSNHISLSKTNIVFIGNDQITIRRIDFDRPALLSSLLV